MDKVSENRQTSKIKKILISVFWIVILALTTLFIMMWISPGAKALPYFLIGFFIVEVLIVLVALYINYVVNLYKQLRKK